MINKLKSFFKEPEPEPFEPNREGYDPKAGLKLISFALRMYECQDRKLTFYLIAGLVLIAPLVLYSVITSPAFFSQAKSSNPVIVNFSK